MKRKFIFDSDNAAPNVRLCSLLFMLELDEHHAEHKTAEADSLPQLVHR
jgi:hypothetical protein